jgi:hypothetical protein
MHGSARATRQAGTQHATMTTATRNMADAANAIGLTGDIRRAVFEPEAQVLLARIELMTNHYEVRANTASDN